MKTILAATALLLTATSCGDTYENLVIGDLRARAPEEDCAGPSDGTVNIGFVDVAIPFVRYSPLVEMFYRGSINSSGGQAPVVALKGFNISLESEQLNLDGIETKFSTLSRATLPADGASVFATAEMLSAETLEKLKSQVSLGQTKSLIISFEAFGSQDSRDIDSQTSSIQVNVCNGCARQNVGKCVEFTASDDPDCSPFGNLVQQCCTTLAGTEACPGFAEEEPTI